MMVDDMKVQRTFSNVKSECSILGVGKPEIRQLFEINVKTGAGTAARPRHIERD
jgi:hypothetical protein